MAQLLPRRLASPRARLRATASALSLAAGLALFPGPGEAAEPPPLFDRQALATAAFGNDAPWYLAHAPLLDTPDALVGQVYHYRWQLLRSHIRDIGRQGAVFTEFLPEVGWDRKPYSTINDSAAFPILEGRWMRDGVVVDQFIDYLHESAGNNRQYSESVADAVWQRYLVTGDRAGVVRHLEAMRYVYNAWDDHYDPARGLYWIEPLFDATEYTISAIDASGGRDGFTGGMAFRPTINTYQFANARAIARIAELAGRPEVARDYDARAAALKQRVQQDLWNPSLTHFSDRYQRGNEFVKAGEFIRGRELAGYLPWVAELPDDTPAFAAAWRHLLSTDEFQGPFGLRTVGPSFPAYMKQYRYFPGSRRPECQWNGPVWPFQVSQVLTGLANLLDDYHQDAITPADYVRLLHDYTRLHLQDGRPDLQEDYDPETGRAIVGDARSPHYLHSSYIDLVIGGLIGLRPRAGDTLAIHPLLPADPRAPGYWPWFALEGVPWHGHLLTVFFDEDGRHYGRGAGLTVLVDGRVAAHAPRLEPVELRAATLAHAPAPARTNLAASLDRGRFPRPSASTGDEPDALYAPVDGRLWFFPEPARGWSTRGAASPSNWYQLDLGAPAQVGAAELAFAADDAHAAPASYRLALRVDGRWQDAPVSAWPAPLANGVTSLRWPAVRADAVKLVVEDVPGRATRVLSLRLFAPGP